VSISISNRFAALENLDTEVDINRIWETIRENIKVTAKNTLGYHELKSISRGSVNDAQNYWTKGKKPNCSGYRIQAK
jgi:hypothetical protein